MPASKARAPRHSDRDLRRHRGRRVLIGLLAVVLFAVSGAGFAYHGLQSQVKQVDITRFLDGSSRPSQATGNEETQEANPSDPYAGRAVNILVMGSDTREGDNNVDGSQGSEEVAVARSDTAMLAHLSADRQRVDVVSIPRDTLVTVPECLRADGTRTRRQSRAMFNSAFANGAGNGSDATSVAAGAACVIKTVEELTGLYVDEFIVVDFTGLTRMVDALGGVNVYVDEKIKDTEYTGLVLPVGCQHLDGATALEYARVRHGVGDGSDTSRISRQQKLVAAMLRTAMSKNLLTSLPDLYSFASAALSTLTTSEKIGNLTTLAGLAMSVQSLGVENISFLTMPNTPAPSDPNRVVATRAATAVWKALREDTPVPSETVAISGTGATATPTEAAAPGASDTSSATATQDAAGTTASSPAATPAPGTGTTDSEASAEPDPAAQCK